MTSKALLTQSGRSFMINYRKFMMLEPILFYPSSPSAILPLSGSLIEEFSAQAESHKKISTESPKPQAPLYKQQSIMLVLMFWEHVEDLRREESVQRGSIFSKNAQAYLIPYIDQISYYYLERWSWAIHQGSWEITQWCHHDRAPLLQNKQSCSRWRSNRDGAFQEIERTFC